MKATQRIPNLARNLPIPNSNLTLTQPNPKHNSNLTLTRTLT